MFKLKSLVAVLAFSVFSVEADSVNFEMKENIALSGKIATVKTSSKYKSSSRLPSSLRKEKCMRCFCVRFKSW